jgi:hypothetical protein
MVILIAWKQTGRTVIYAACRRQTWLYQRNDHNTGNEEGNDTPFEHKHLRIKSYLRYSFLSADVKERAEAFDTTFDPYRRQGKSGNHAPQ